MALNRFLQGSLRLWYLFFESIQTCWIFTRGFLRGTSRPGLKTSALPNKTMHLLHPSFSLSCLVCNTSIRKSLNSRGKCNLLELTGWVCEDRGSWQVNERGDVVKRWVAPRQDHWLQAWYVSVHDSMRSPSVLWETLSMVPRRCLHLPSSPERLITNASWNPGPSKVWAWKRDSTGPCHWLLQSQWPIRLRLS